MAEKAKSPKRAAKPGKSGNSAKKDKGGPLGRVAKIAGIVVLALLLIAAVIGIVFYERTELPDPNADFTTQTTRLYFRDGTSELGSLAIQNRTNISYDDMPQSTHTSTTRTLNSPNSDCMSSSSATERIRPEY